MPNQNYFSLLNINLEFDIDINDLYRKYISLHQSYNANSQNNNLPYLNQAYEILKCPLKRATYILTLIDRNIDEIKSEEINTFLQDFYDELELLEDITLKEEIENFIEKKTKTKKNILSQMSTSYKNDIEDFIIQTIYLTYCIRIIDHAKKKLFNT